MKRRFLKIILVLVFVAAICFAVLASAGLNPYLYTKLHGDDGTERLYQLFRLSEKEGVQVDQLVKFAGSNRIVIINFERDGLLTAHNDSETNSEEVHVWYSNGRVTEAEFTINNP